MIKILDHLRFLYGEETAPRLFERAQFILEEYRVRIHPQDGRLTERDSLMITYGDQVQRPSEKPLRTLNNFCEQYLSGVVSGVHILPFYPWTSDDGFSVVDHRRIDSILGDWGDVLSLRKGFRLMFDGVINHISAGSEWFEEFLRDHPQYRNYFVVVEGSPDLSQVVRPRALPLLTEFDTSSGKKRVWTTFSEDQIDLNFKNPDVLFEILDILLMYAERGASLIRLDAIAYLWKEIGTTCIHLPQTHRVIQFLRAALDVAAPHVHLVTETNVPHADNLSYFGDGANEAQLVYNFALPPLTLHAFHSGDASMLSRWAGTLTLPSDQTTFFNFLASHDGIGLNPARGILPDEDVNFLVEKSLEHGGFISYKQNPDGTQSPYEMNINYFDALSNPKGNEPVDLQVDRFIAAQAIMLSLLGIPGIYFHSLFGSRGWIEGVRQTGRNRTINREKCLFDELEKELKREASLRSKVFTRYSRLLKARSDSPAFHPHGRQKIHEFHSSVFAVERISPDENLRAWCLHNVSGRRLVFKTEIGQAIDLLTREPVSASEITLEPYQILWMGQ